MSSFFTLKRCLGGYEPAFFRIELDYSFYSGRFNLFSLSPKELSVFVHEYIHFVQDISTFTGLNNAYVYSEYIHGVVNQIYKLPKGDIRVPVKIENNFGNIALNQFVNEAGLGWTEDEVSTLIIKRLKRIKKKVPYESYIKTVDEVFIVHMNGPMVPFGTHAIRESMAYIMEKHLTTGSPSAPDYPYNAAIAVGRYIFSDFCDNDLNILALCDMCLQFSTPGKIFVDTLYDFKEKGFVPQKPQDVYDFFYNRPCIQMKKEVSFLSGLLPFGIMVGELINDYLKDEYFYPFHSVVRQMIGIGLMIRLEAKYFMLDMVEEGIRVGGDLSKNKLFFLLYTNLGSPVIKDSYAQYYIVPPGGMSDNTSVSMFQAVQQFVYLFRDGNTCCGLYEWCEQSPDVDHDDRCIIEPWSRCEDERLCPFALLWRHWKLKGYIPQNVVA